MNYRNLSLSLTHALLHAEAEGGPAAVATATARPALSVAIAREAGSLGHSVARLLGPKLGWPVYDQEILDKIAEEMRRPPTQLEVVDERPAHWLEEALT